MPVDEMADTSAGGDAANSTDTETLRARQRDCYYSCDYRAITMAGDKCRTNRGCALVRVK